MKEARSLGTLMMSIGDQGCSWSRLETSIALGQGSTWHSVLKGKEKE